MKRLEHRLPIVGGISYEVQQHIELRTREHSQVHTSFFPLPSRQDIVDTVKEGLGMVKIVITITPCHNLEQKMQLSGL